MSANPMPLLDFFKRGEVTREVKLLAAAGVLAPRAHEQLAILIHLLDDADRDVRGSADATLSRIPAESLAAFLGRSDVPIGIREFFADRGVFPAEIPAITADDALIDTDAQFAAPDSVETVAGSDEARVTASSQLATMSFSERLKTAMKGSREMRALLIRDPNKMIAAAVLSSPKLTEQEVEAFSRMATIADEILRIIATTRAWIKNYQVVVGLTRNPKMPVALSMNLMARLNERDLQALSMDRNIAEPLRAAARRKIVAGHSRS